MVTSAEVSLTWGDLYPKGFILLKAPSHTHMHAHTHHMWDMSALIQRCEKFVFFTASVLNL